MAIHGISLHTDFSNMAVSKVTSTDTNSKTLQNQLASKEQSLNRLSSDSKLTAEEKAKERQELQKQIAELNRKLKLLQMEREEEAKKAQKEQEQKAALQEELNSTQISSNVSDAESKVNPVPAESNEKHNSVEQSKESKADKPKPEPSVLSNHDVQEMLIANSNLQKNRIQNQVMNQKEHTEHILESEIKMDEIYGNNTTLKQEELNALQSKPLFEIEVLSAPKQSSHSTLGISDKAKIIIVE